MPVANKIKNFLKAKGITPYRFQKEAGIAANTAYGLHENPLQIPHVTSLNKICDAYEIQPGDILAWIPPNKQLEQEDSEAIKAYLQPLLDQPNSKEILTAYVEVLMGIRPIEQCDLELVSKALNKPIKIVEDLVQKLSGSDK